MKKFIEFVGRINEEDELFENWLIENHDKLTEDFIDNAKNLGIGMAKGLGGAAIGAGVALATGGIAPGIAAMGGALATAGIIKSNHYLGNRKHAKLAIAAYKAKHGKADSNDIKILVNHKNPGVRKFAAESPNLTHKHVNKLLNDPNARVRNHMQANYGNWLYHQGKHLHGDFEKNDLESEFNFEPKHDHDFIKEPEPKEEPAVKSNRFTKNFEFNKFHGDLYKYIVEKHKDILHNHNTIAQNGISSSAYQATDPANHEQIHQSIHHALLNNGYSQSGDIYVKKNSFFKITRNPGSVELRHSNNLGHLKSEDDFKVPEEDIKSKPNFTVNSSGEAEHHEFNSLHNNIIDNYKKQKRFIKNIHTEPSGNGNIHRYFTNDSNQSMEMMLHTSEHLKSIGYSQTNPTFFSKTIGNTQHTFNVKSEPHPDGTYSLTVHHHISQTPNTQNTEPVNHSEPELNGQENSSLPKQNSQNLPRYSFNQFTSPKTESPKVEPKEEYRPSAREHLNSLHAHILSKFPEIKGKNVHGELHYSNLNSSNENESKNIHNEVINHITSKGFVQNPNNKTEYVHANGDRFHVDHNYDKLGLIKTVKSKFATGKVRIKFDPLVEPHEQPKVSVTSHPEVKTHNIPTGATLSNVSTNDGEYTIHTPNQPEIKTAAETVKSEPTVKLTSKPNKNSSKLIHLDAIEHVKNSGLNIAALDHDTKPRTDITPKNKDDKELIQKHLHNYFTSNGFTHSKELSFPDRKGFLGNSTHDVYTNSEGHKFEVKSHPTSIRLERK